MTDDNVVQLAARLIACPSITPDDGGVPVAPYGEARMAHLLRDILLAWGADVRIQEVLPGRLNVIARFGPARPGPRLLLEAHSDTVAVDGMRVEPFTPQVQNGRLYGRGACDVKGPMAAVLCGIRSYMETHGDPPGELYFASTCGEESDAAGIRALIADSHLRPDAVIAAEPTDFNVIHAHKGVLRYHITTHGRAAHSSSPELGVNAIDKMRKVMDQLDRYRLSLASICHPELGSPTVSFGIIRGGNQANIIPDSCSIHVDQRLLPSQSPSATEQDLRECIAATDNADPDRPSSFELGQTYPPLEIDPADPLVESVLAGARTIHQEAQTTVAHYATNGGFCTSAGIPAVVFGPGSIRQAHTADEYISVSELHKGVSAYAAIIHEWFESRQRR